VFEAIAATIEATEARAVPRAECLRRIGTDAITVLEQIAPQLGLEGEALERARAGLLDEIVAEKARAN
jgi:hypothetical protein